MNGDGDIKEICESHEPETLRTAVKVKLVQGENSFLMMPSRSDKLDWLCARRRSQRER